MKPLWSILIAMLAAPAAAVTCEDIDHKGSSYSICTVDATTENLSLYLDDATGTPYGSFANIAASLDVQSLVFATNAGMYHDNRAPVGFYREDGADRMRLITNPGPGNFGLLPNGLLCITDTRAMVYETLAFEADQPDCPSGTQSGPMLVIDGDLHPRFLPDGTSKNIRNGVGSTANGDRAVFAISNDTVNFHDFGTLFRDRLNLPNALYFDGRVSRLHATDLNRSDRGPRMGPIVAVTE